MLDRVGRSISRASISLKPARFIDRGEFLRRRRTSCSPRPAARSRGSTSSSSSASRSVARLPSPPISPAKRPPGLSERKIARAACSLSSTQCSVALEKAASNSAAELHVRRVHQHGVDALGPRAPRPSRANCRCRRQSRPRSMIFAVSVPSPQPTSRICSPGCGSSRSSAAPPSSATKPPTRA